MNRGKVKVGGRGVLLQPTVLGFNPLMNRGKVKEHGHLTLRFTGSNIPFALAAVKWQLRIVDKVECLYLSPLFISIARVSGAYFTTINLF